MEINFTNMEDNFDDFAVPIESDVLSQDFDDVDLYGDKYEEKRKYDSQWNLQKTILRNRRNKLLYVVQSDWWQQQKDTHGRFD